MNIPNGMFTVLLGNGVYHLLNRRLEGEITAMSLFRAVVTHDDPKSPRPLSFWVEASSPTQALKGAMYELREYRPNWKADHIEVTLFKRHAMISGSDLFEHYDDLAS